MTDKIVVLTSCGSEEEANKLARALLEKRLAACVNIISDVQSLYHWQGRIESSIEFTLLIKSRRLLFEEISREIRQVHSYAVPEVVAIPVTDGDSAYLNWIDEETTSGE